MLVLQVTEGMDLALGGTTQYVVSLCNSLSQEDIGVEVCALGDARGSGKVQMDANVSYTALTPVGPKSAGLSTGVSQKLNEIPNIDLIHQHGLWLDIYRITGRYSRSRDLPLLISLHGMLEPWSLNRNKWRKRMAWHMWQGREIHNATCLHVATEREAENIRNLNIKTPIAVIPNGIDTNVIKPVKAIEELYPGLRKNKYILFLGRLHPVKGLEQFVRAWAEICSEYPDHVLVLAGPDEDDHKQELTRIINSGGIGSKVKFVGPVSGESKDILLQNCSFLILPSLLESFGLVVLEAFLFGRPVMVSQNCPWSKLEQLKCGWWVSRDLDSWKCALKSALGLSDQELEEMGAQGKEWVNRSFSQKHVLSEMIAVYKWMTGNGDRPKSIVLSP